MKFYVATQTQNEPGHARDKQTNTKGIIKHKKKSEGVADVLAGQNRLHYLK